MKRTLSILLATLMVLALIPFSAFSVFAAESGTCGDNLYWNFSNGHLSITGSGAMTSYPWKSFKSQITKVTFPYGLTSICSSAFYGCTNLQNVTIPSSVKTINSYAFQNCTSFTSITIPANVEKLYNGSFAGCSNVTAFYYYPDELEIFYSNAFDSIGTETSGVTVTFGEGVKIIPSSIFEGNKYIKKVNFSDTITTIGSSAFYGCTNLQNITIPSSVKTIDSYAFQNCTS
ncbi:MAG: leucine-rich repeat domain-containing protein, partial [Clostridia bacterium]|nr:leucine-rich repeat domain-containing protein [Clostridia bacterium]